MNKLLSVAFLFSVVSCSSPADNNGLSRITITSERAPVTIFVEVAATSQERATGLMHRSFLPMDQGMLFLSPNEKLESYWMKNTLIPLDIIFIARDKKIVHMEKNVPPCKKDPCPLYSSGTKVLYVLETNGGFADRYGIREGDTIVLPSDL